MYELLRDQRLQGRVKDKYRLANGNLGLVVEDDTGQRYAVVFQTDHAEPRLANLYGLVDEPFQGRGEDIGRLIAEGDRIDLSVGYRRDSPLRVAYGLNSVSRVSPGIPGRAHPPRIAYDPRPGYR